MSKAEIMKLANRLIDSLYYCNDEEFVDRVIAAVVSAETFDYDEIEEVSNNE